MRTYECNDCGQVVEVDDETLEHIDFGQCKDCFEQSLDEIMDELEAGIQ